MSSIINTASNAFTYTESSDNSIYVANTVNDKLMFDTIPVNNYIDSIDNKISNVTPTFYNIQSANNILTASTEVTVAQIKITSCNKMIVSIAVPVKLDDFLKITNSDSINISIKVDDTEVAKYSTPFNIQPVTLINMSFTVENIPAGTLKIDVTSSLPAIYLMGTNKVDDVGLLPFNANTAICF